MEKIKDGYYIKARCIQESLITSAPPHIREIWDWLLKEAQYATIKYDGFIIERGQLFTTYNDIRQGLKWKIGYRTEQYSENQIKKAMMFLRKEQMIITTKEPRGVLITICNYDRYQNPKNYETTKTQRKLNEAFMKDPNERTTDSDAKTPHEGTNEGTTSEPAGSSSVHPLVKKENNDKKEKNKETPLSPLLENAQFKKLWNGWVDMRKQMKIKNTPLSLQLNIKKLEKWGIDKAIKSLEQSIENEYRGIFEPKSNRLPKNTWPPAEDNWRHDE